MKAGRPIVTVPRSAVAALRDGPERLTWKEIAEKLGISRRTAIRIYTRTHKGTESATTSTSTKGLDFNHDFGA